MSTADVVSRTTHGRILGFGVYLDRWEGGGNVRIIVTNTFRFESRTQAVARLEAAPARIDANKKERGDAE